MWSPTCPEPEPEPASPSAALSLPSPPTPPPTPKNGRDPYSTQQNWRTLYLAQLHRKENGKKNGRYPYITLQNWQNSYFTRPHRPTMSKMAAILSRQNGQNPLITRQNGQKLIRILRGLHAPNSASRRPAVLTAYLGYLIKICLLPSV